MRRKLLSCLLVVSMVLSLITALPITANAEDNNCLIVETNNEYATLQDALAARTDGQTIKLLSDITHNSAIQVDSAALDLKIDLNGKTLTVNASGSCISAYNNVEIEVIDSVEGGSLVANTTSEGSIALRAESYGTITVDAPLTINATSNGSWGIRTYAAGSVIVTDAEINATRMGVESYGDWNNHTDPSQIIVTGNITTSAEEEDCGAYAYSGGKVYVTGDVVSSSIGVYSEGGTISVTGNVTGNSVGAQAYDGGAINVTGNVTANGDLGCGATVITSSSVQIDGVINAPVYVNIGGDNLTAANTYEPTRLVGYYTYANASDPSNYVLVKGIYSVTFDTQGGSTIGSVTTDYDTTITQPSAPTRNGYIFGGLVQGICLHR